MPATRRRFLATAGACLALPAAARATGYREITWDDLIPPGVPYAEIIGEGELDEVKDTWNPIYDANASKLNQDLAGAAIRMPGFIVPLEIGAEGVTDFILVPYVGACIHVPPPPANQLVYVASPPPGRSMTSGRRSGSRAGYRQSCAAPRSRRPAIASKPSI